jgi:C2 domain
MLLSSRTLLAPLKARGKVPKVYCVEFHSFVFAWTYATVFALSPNSDPFVIATRIATEPGSQATVIGKSEVIKNNLSPNWVKVFVIDYELGTTTKVALSIFDEVRKGENIPMGSGIFDVAEVLGARGCTKGKKLRGGGM